MEKVTFGQAIKEKRKEKGLTAVQLARETGISQPYISQLENNKFKPSTDVIVKMSKALDLPFPYLYLLADNEEGIDQKTMNIFQNLDQYRELGNFDSYEEFIEDTKRISKRGFAEPNDKESVKELFEIVQSLLLIEDYYKGNKDQKTENKMIDKFVSIGAVPDLENQLLANGEIMMFKGKPLELEDRKKLLAIADIIFRDKEE